MSLQQVEVQMRQETLILEVLMENPPRIWGGLNGTKAEDPGELFLADLEDPLTMRVRNPKNYDRLMRSEFNGREPILGRLVSRISRLS